MSKNRSLGKQNICGESIKINCSNVYMFINILKRNIKFKAYLFSKIQLVLKKSSFEIIPKHSQFGQRTSTKMIFLYPYKIHNNDSN